MKKEQVNEFIGKRVKVVIFNGKIAEGILVNNLPELACSIDISTMQQLHSYKIQESLFIREGKRE